MGSADGTSINIDRLTCTWKVEMERENSIKKGGNETEGSKKKGKFAWQEKIIG